MRERLAKAALCICLGRELLLGELLGVAVQYIVLPLPPFASLCFDELLELGVVRGQFFRRQIHVVADCSLLAELELALGLEGEELLVEAAELSLGPGWSDLGLRMAVDELWAAALALLEGAFVGLFHSKFGL